MPDTILITVQADIERLEKTRDEIAETLRELSDDVRALKERLRAGDVEKSTDVTKLLGDLRYWLRAANETEAKLEDLRRRDAGLCGAYGLDLDAARVAIGCRLHRIRQCCNADEVSE